MANNYMQSAFELVVNLDERDFIKKLCDRAFAIAYDDAEPSDSPFEQNVKENGWGWVVAYPRDRAHFSCEESANVEALVLGLQAFLAHFKLRDVLTISWSYTCSAPRAGEFSGGGVVFTATNAQWIDVGMELRRLHTELLKAPSGP